MMIQTPSATSVPDLLGEPEVDRRVRARARLSVFVRRTSLLVGGALLLLILVLVSGAPLFTGYDPTAQDPNAILQRPSPSHIMGTDQLGRDIFARVLSGGRYTLLASVLAVLIGALLGTGLGLLAGFFGGLVENAGMRLVDFLLAFPGILLALAITTILGPAVVAHEAGDIGEEGDTKQHHKDAQAQTEQAPREEHVADRRIVIRCGPQGRLMSGGQPHKEAPGREQRERHP
jgi:hypothetical protein